MKYLEFTELASNYDYLLFDVWGVIFQNDAPFPKVISQINLLSSSGKNIFYITNAPQRDITIQKRLMGWGVHKADLEHIITSGDLTRVMMAEYCQQQKLNAPSIYHLIAEGQESSLLDDFPHSKTDDIASADIMVLTIHMTENEDIDAYYPLLKEAARSKCKIFCANPDVIIPTNGIKKYGPGYFASKIEEYGGKVEYCGKPKAPIFAEALKRIEVAAKLNNALSDIDKVLMIGDSLKTDILGGNSAGIDTALVVTGNSATIHDSAIDNGSKVRLIEAYANKIGGNVMPLYLTDLNV